MNQAWLGLGSNLGQPVEQLKMALTKLANADGIVVEACSSFYQTPPWGDEHQDDFINAVARIRTALEPLTLLQVMQSIEDGLGRRRSARRWGPRVIDLDMLLYEGRSCQTPELELPHPRVHERAFVLLPMSELNPGLEVMGKGSVTDLLRGLDCSGIRKLPEYPANVVGVFG